ncbi:MAG: hypothetical protein JKY65_18800 [Planctomycetes bacterium]|nr:hypothetical protein [Planctomycetota bacterium]
MSRLSHGLVRRSLICAGALALGFLAAQPADALYLFYMRKDLAYLLKKQPKTVIGKKIVVTDEMTVIWPEVQQRKDRLKGTKYVLFDTTYFRCAVPSDKMGSHLESIADDARKGYGAIIEEVEALNTKVQKGEMAREAAVAERTKLYWRMHRVYSNRPIVTVFAKVERADFWGDVVGRGNGVATEIVTLLVDKIEKPRRRWYRTLDQ